MDFYSKIGLAGYRLQGISSLVVVVDDRMFFLVDPHGVTLLGVKLHLPVLGPCI